MTMARDDSFKEFILDQLQGLAIDCRAMFAVTDSTTASLLSHPFKDRLYRDLAWSRKTTLKRDAVVRLTPQTPGYTRCRWR